MGKIVSFLVDLMKRRKRSTRSLIQRILLVMIQRILLMAMMEEELRS